MGFFSSGELFHVESVCVLQCSLSMFCHVFLRRRPLHSADYRSEVFQLCPYSCVWSIEKKNRLRDNWHNAKLQNNSFLNVLYNNDNSLLTVDVQSSCVADRTQGVGGFTSVEPSILDSHTGDVYVANDVTSLIYVLTYSVSVAHCGCSEHLTV